MKQQIPLSLTLPEQQYFDTFDSRGNEEAITQLQQYLLQPAALPLIYIYASHASGKSHILQACCHLAEQQSLNAAYIPLKSWAQHPSDIISHLCTADLLCIDDVQCAAGKPDWEEALFKLFNDLQEKKGRLIVAAGKRPAECGLHLADLASRLSWGLTLKIQPLDEEGRKKRLIQLAKDQGMSLSASVVDYLMSHHARDLPTLLKILDHADKASLAEGRKITIPFLKQLLQKG
ncbi:MAG: DnaA regulatory inactivator Hda [gamma proteobacterium symbiont of Bathyaustriella thionipta]|nr:DnaA regulatory inactivator Hda [gamma proteobacterium symbiont of Bathyaustriella thionipta]